MSRCFGLAERISSVCSVCFLSLIKILSTNTLAMKFIFSMTPSIAAAVDQPLIERTTHLQRQLLNPRDSLHQFAADGDYRHDHHHLARILLIRPDEVLSCIFDMAVLKVADNALRGLFQHRHMRGRRLA